MAETAEVLHDIPASLPEANQTAKKPIYRINHANAREMAHRSAMAKRAAKEARLNPPVPDPQEQDKLHVHAIKELLRQIAILDAAFGEAKSPSDYRDLTMAKERLFKQWTHLAGIAGPGNYKPRSSRSRQASIPDPIPLPEPNQAAG